jgi:hypothetical protein
MDDLASSQTPTAPVSMRAVARELSGGRRELHSMRGYMRDLLVVTQCMLAVMVAAIALYAVHWWVVGR